jgi:AcrR family transcriptional regulator
MTAQGMAETADTRERILEAAALCFARFGIAKTTLGDVAREAGVARVTVYRQFVDKEALFAGTTARIIRRRWRDIADGVGSRDSLREWVLAVLQENWRQLQDTEFDRMYRDAGAYDEGLAFALTSEGLDCIIEPMEHHIAGRGLRRQLASGVEPEDLAEWMHWVSFMIASHRSQRLKTEEDWLRWLRPQLAGLLSRSA